jgi:hypothetical protein
MNFFMLVWYWFGFPRAVNAGEAQKAAARRLRQRRFVAKGNKFFSRELFVGGGWKNKKAAA